MKRRHSHSARSRYLAALALLAPATPLAMASPADGAERADGPVISLDETVVTAAKRAESVQDMPASIFVATRDQFERAQVREFTDLASIAPSLTITTPSQPANNSINIRGVGTYAFSIATEPSVAVVVDDIPRAFQAAAFSALVDVRQVEVLRGPQSALFGKSASAGVINITTEPATPTFTAFAGVFATDDDEYRFAATASGPITEALRFRLAANYSDFRGTTYNLGTGHWVNGQSDITARSKLEWEPSSAWRITLSPYYNHTISSCCQWVETFVSPGVTFGRSRVDQSVVLRGITVGPSNTDSRMDVDARANAVDYGSGLKVSRLFGDVELTSISSYDRYTLTDLQDTDSSDFDFQAVAPTAPHGGSANGGRFKVNAVTQEFRLTSPDTDRLRYVAGLYYSRTSALRFFVRGSNTLGDYNGLPSLPSTNSTTYAAYVGRAVDVNYAAYGQGSFALTDRFDVIGGLRLNREALRYSFQDLATGVSYGRPRCSTVSPTVQIQTCNHDTTVSGKIGVQYRVTPNLMTFATYSRGWKGFAYDITSTLTVRTPLTAGPQRGIPTADAVAAKQPIPAERVDAYELGFKSRFLDRRVTWNATLFDEEFHDFQAQSRDQLTSQNVLNSIGHVYSRGFETEAVLQVNDSFSVNLAGAYVKAVMKSFPNAACFPAQAPAQGCTAGQQDLSGKRLPNAPRWTLSASGQYDFAPAHRDWTPFISGSARYQSKVIYSLLQDPTSVQDGYGLLNLAVGLQSPRWKASIFARNLTNQRFALYRGRDTQFNINPAGAPPTDAVSWKPARDSFRYFGVRFDAGY